MGTTKTIDRVTDRELSWLQFNERVQAEADNPQNPLLERAKFLAIVTSNTDEFMQVRYHGVLEKARGKHDDRPTACGLTPDELLKRVNKAILHQQNMQYLLYEGLQSELYMRDVRMYPVFTLTRAMREQLEELFRTDLENALKAVAWDDEAPLPQKWLHICVRLHVRDAKKPRHVFVTLPASLPRLYELSAEDGKRLFIRLEDVVKLNLPLLFPDERIEEASMFRLLRNQDFPPDTASGDDIPPAIREMLRMRRTGRVMRLEAEERMSGDMLELLIDRFDVPADQRYRVTGPLDLNKLLMTLYGMLDLPELKYAPAEPTLVTELMGDDVFERIAARDYLLFHPYHSFAPVVHLMQRAAQDPDVCSVKQTLYRVSKNSPIVQALVEAAENGKEVTVLFEAHARFDEENNLFWGERLKRAGCNVIFGLPGLKVHSKITLITRMENGEPKRYLHLGTGNYHDGTAKLYTDMGLLTADEALGEDACSFFYQLEGYQHFRPTMELKKAPDQMQTTLLQLIDRERENAAEGLPCGVIAKMNSLLDPTVIDALYDASRAGVPIELIVRGICTLIPGVKGMSETIRVTSIVGRNLEHARAFRFENAGAPEVYLSSADWMPRNLLKRVELMFPIKDERCRRGVENVLRLQLADNVKGWRLQADGEYARKSGEPRVNAQETLLADVEGVLNG